LKCRNQLIQKKLHTTGYISLTIITDICTAYNSFSGQHQQKIQISITTAVSYSDIMHQLGNDNKYVHQQMNE